MKLEYTDGCICTSMLVDGRDLNLDLSTEEQKNVASRIVDYIIDDASPLVSFYECYLDESDIIHEIDYSEYYRKFDSMIESFNRLSTENKKELINKLIDQFTSGCAIQELYLDFCRRYGKMEHQFDCDECGDSVYTWSIEI